MPSPIAHSVTGYLLARHPIAKKIAKRYLPRRLLSVAPVAALYGVFVSNLPDLDFVPQIVTGLHFHRGPSHSLFAAILVSGLLALVIHRIQRRTHYKMLFGISFCLYSAHLLMDMFTAGGSGIPLLWPLSAQAFRAPFALFPAVHHSRGLWDSSHLVFITAELLYSLVLLSAIGLTKGLTKSWRTDAQAKISSR